MTNLTPYLPLDTVAWPLRKDDGVSSLDTVAWLLHKVGVTLDIAAWPLHKNDIQDLRWFFSRTIQWYGLHKDDNSGRFVKNSWLPAPG